MRAPDYPLLANTNDVVQGQYSRYHQQRWIHRDLGGLVGVLEVRRGHLDLTRLSRWSHGEEGVEGLTTPVLTTVGELGLTTVREASSGPDAQCGKIWRHLYQIWSGSGAWWHPETHI